MESYTCCKLLFSELSCCRIRQLPWALIYQPTKFGNVYISAGFFGACKFCFGASKIMSCWWNVCIWYSGSAAWQYAYWFLREWILELISKRFSRMGGIHIQITKGSDSPLTERKQLHGTSVFLSCEISPFLKKKLRKFWNFFPRVNSIKSSFSFC